MTSTVQVAHLKSRPVSRRFTSARVRTRLLELFRPQPRLRRVVVACLRLNEPRRDASSAPCSSTTIILCRSPLSAIYNIISLISLAVTSRYALRHESKKQRCSGPSIGPHRVLACKFADEGLFVVRRAEDVAAGIWDYTHDSCAQSDDTAGRSSPGSG